MLNANVTVRFLKTFKSCVFCKIGWVFRKKPCNFQKSLMVTNLLYNAREIVRFLKTFKFWDLEVLKKTSVFEKNWSLLKWQKQQTCRRIDWNCNSPQKVQTSGFFKMKKKGFFEQKSGNYKKWLAVATLQ